MYSVKENFETNYEENLMCELCRTSKCSQSHLFECPIIQAFIPEIVEQEIKYEFIFGKNNEMKQVAPILEKISKIRDLLIDDISHK